MAGGVSFFRVGDNVELWRVTEFLCVLVVCVMLFEQVLHKAEHAAHKYPKYHEMLSKVYRELMILGLIGLGVKMVKEVSLVDGYGKNMIAFQVADLAIFILALALIIQSICVFSLLRSTNKEMDHNELVGTDDLLHAVKQHRRMVQNQSCLQRLWPWGGRDLAAQHGIKGKRFALSAAKYDDMVTMRTLRHYFLRRYKLPQLFPFAKYLRHAQDNQITHMIDVEVSAWVLLITVAWALDGATQLVEEWSDELERHAIVSVFLVFSWALTLLHFTVLGYLVAAKKTIRAAAGYYTRHDVVECLDDLSSEEKFLTTRERAADVIEIMQSVQDRQEALQLKKNNSHHFKHDTGLQLLESVFKKIRGRCCGAAKYQQNPSHDVYPDLENGRHPTGDLDVLSPLPHVKIFGFSRKGLHFVVKFLLMLNGFYVALMCLCVLYEMGEVYSVFGPVPAVLVPLPLVINMLVFQPQICHNFILVSSIFRVDVATLSEVISHFSESMELRSDFVACLTRTMKENGQTVANLHAEFVGNDPSGSGMIEIEDLRLVLRKFGCQVSYYRFNGVAKLLFRLKGTKVEYVQVERLIKLAEEDDLRASSVAFAEGFSASIFNRSRFRQTVIAEETAAQRSLQSSFASLAASTSTSEVPRANNRKLLQTHSARLPDAQQVPPAVFYPSECPTYFIAGDGHSGPSPLSSTSSAAGSQYNIL